MALRTHLFLIAILGVLLFTTHTNAFGAGNIASISAIEGKNWRHGDIEDVIKTLACIRHHKWTSMMVKRVYFGNWLRDYSQAMDTAALGKANAETIKILVWLLSFLSFGYATAEFEVTSERLGVYRPEEHIDNPKDYNDNRDARPFDPRLRAPTRQIELDIDRDTGMKNYIANGTGDWATSAAYVKYSFERCIHHGRLYTNGRGLFKGKDEDLAEALRLLGQGLHTLEDFGAHTNYVELALRELGFHDVFAHVGTATAIILHGKQVYPLVTGTFGTVDFYHSVLGEASDHFTQSEVNEMDDALGTAQTAAQSSNPLMTLVRLLSKVPGTRDLCDEAESLQRASDAQARSIAESERAPPSQWGAWNNRGMGDQTVSYGSGQWDNVRAPQPDWSIPEAVPPAQPPGYGMNPSHGQQHYNYDQSQPPSWNYGQDNYGQQQVQSQPPWAHQQPQYNHPEQPFSFNMQDQPQADPHASIEPQQTPAVPQQQTASAPTSLPGLPNFDPEKTIKQIYPILAFRDKVVRAVSAVIEKIPGLEALVDRITETLTVFVLSLLAPFVRPVIKGISAALQSGSASVIYSSGQHQYEVWTNPNCSDPTHSMLSKDHFSNLLNEPAGYVAAEILKFIVPRVLYAWEHADVPVQQVLNDVEGIFHHPAIREERNELHRNMYEAVRKWSEGNRQAINDVLTSEGVRTGKNLKASANQHGHTHGPVNQSQGLPSVPFGSGPQQHGGSQTSGPFGAISDLLGKFSGQNHPQNQQHQGSSFGNILNTFTGQGHPQHQQSSQPGGIGNMLNMAGRLPIPGVQNFAGKVNQYSNFFPGSNRELDDDSLNPAQVGGSEELHQAMEQHDYNSAASDSSTMALQAPSGYEGYGRGERGAYSGEGYQYGSEPQNMYEDDAGQGYGRQGRQYDQNRY